MSGRRVPIPVVAVPALAVAVAAPCRTQDHVTWLTHQPDLRTSPQTPEPAAACTRGYGELEA